jgi:hypothetical protein
MRSTPVLLGMLLTTAALALPQPLSGQLSTEVIAQAASPAVGTITVRGAQAGSGSGFIVSDDGYLITNAHVISGASAASFTLPSGQRFENLRVLAVDHRSDLAILKIDGVSLSALSLGNSDSVNIGADLVVIGSPLGLHSTVSTGIVSARRELDGRVLFQISAPISPGSSGGPVLDRSGDVIGISVAQIREGQNLNFAVPVNYVLDLLTRARTEPGQVLSPIPPERVAPSVNEQLKFDFSDLRPLTVNWRVREADGVETLMRRTVNPITVAGQLTRIEIITSTESQYRRRIVRRTTERHVVDATDLHPISTSATAEYFDGNATQRSILEVTYDRRGVKGYRSDSRDGRREIGRVLPNGIISTPGVAFAYLEDRLLEPSTFIVTIYDPHRDQVQDVRYRVTGKETVRIGNSSVEAWVVQIEGGSSTGTAYYSIHAPRVLLRYTDADFSQQMVSVNR